MCFFTWQKLPSLVNRDLKQRQRHRQRGRQSKTQLHFTLHMQISDVLDVPAVVLRKLPKGLFRQAIFVATNRPCKLAAISWRFVTLKLKKSPVNRVKIRACSKSRRFVATNRLEITMKSSLVYTGDLKSPQKSPLKSPQESPL